MNFSETNSQDEPLLQSPVPETGAPATPPTPSRWHIVWTSGLAFLAAMAICMVLVIIQMVVTFSINGFPGPGNFESLTLSPTFLIGLLVAVEIPLAAIGLFLRHRSRRKGFPQPRLFEYARSSSVVTGIAAGVGLVLFGALNAVLATAIFGKASTPAMEAITRGLAEMKGHPGFAAAAVFTIGVLAPVCEELFFRGALFAGGQAAGRMWTAALVSSILFAAAHENGAMSIYYVAVGLTMCWLFTRTRTLAAPIAAHMTVNLSACIAILFGSGS